MGADPGVAQVLAVSALAKAERPNGLINLVYLAAVLLAVGVVTLGIGLLQA